MSKAIPIMAIAVAFVAGTLVSSVVYADEKNGKPFEAIWNAINEIELTPGPQGATGATGADGTNAIISVYRVETVEKISGGTVTVSATCEEGDTVLGGGFGSEKGPIKIIDKPSTNSDGDDEWIAIFQIDSIVDKDVIVWAVCATITP